MATVGHDRRPPLTRIVRAENACCDRQRRRSGHQPDLRQRPPALDDREICHGSQPRVEGRLADHHRAARQEPGQSKPRKPAPAQIDEEREQGEHSGNRRQKLSGKRERLDERRCTDGCH